MCALPFVLAAGFVTSPAALAQDPSGLLPTDAAVIVRLESLDAAYASISRLAELFGATAELPAKEAFLSEGLSLPIDAAHVDPARPIYMATDVVLGPPMPAFLLPARDASPGCAWGSLRPNSPNVWASTPARCTAGSGVGRGLPDGRSRGWLEVETCRGGPCQAQPGIRVGRPEAAPVPDEGLAAHADLSLVARLTALGMDDGGTSNGMPPFARVYYGHNHLGGNALHRRVSSNGIPAPLSG